MQRLRYLNALLLAALFVAAGCAGSQPSTPPASGGEDGGMTAGTSMVGDIRVSEFDVSEITYPAVEDFQMPDIEKLELDNGMTVYLIEDHELPTVSATARVGAGEVWAPADHAGLASVTGTVMRTGGTQSMSSDEVNQLLENLGATVETSIGQTSGTAYMNTLAENVDRVLPVFADVLMNPAFAEDKIEQAKSQQKTSISRRNENPQQIGFRELNKLVYGADSPYAKVPQYYTIDEITREDVTRFHGKYFTPNNTLLSVWGDFDPAEMKRKLREAFGDWARAEGFQKPEPPAVEGERDYSVNVVPKSDVTQSTILIGHLGEIKRNNPDYFPVIVMNQVLSGGFSGRLFQNVRKDQGLAYSVFGNYGAGYDREGRFFSGVFTKSSSTVEGARAVIEEIERMRQEAPSEEELELAKQSYLNSFVFNFDSRREILDRLMTYEYYGYPQNFLDQIKQGVEDVTAEDVLRVSKKYLHPDQVDILVVGNRENFDQDLATLTKDGTVNEIDISIPTEPPGGPADGEKEAPTATDEQVAAGQDLLAEVREAMGGDAYDDIDNVRRSVETNAGGQTIEQTIATNLAGQVRAEVSTPRGTVTIIDDGEQAFIKTPRGTQPAPPQVRKQFLGGLQRNFSYLMTQPGELEVSDQGTQTVEGTELRALRVTPPGGNAFTLMVDPETMMPARMSFQGQNPQTGQSFEATNVFSDYREKSGVMVPYTTTTYRGGEEAATTTVTGFETNVDFPDGYFSVEQ
ncbi:MAG: insulinase family protein [Bacteroidetes bacterium QS_8_68_15]|nr:MAG: insulinase family protein [Bacteroidetes bacterium QS_8_68_15]